jgi:hypothetical protein
MFTRNAAGTAGFSVFRFLLILGLLFPAGVFSQVPVDGETDSGLSRGSIPEDLLRPQRGESPRYPIDMVIGSLGRGDAPEEAYRFSRTIMAALVRGEMSDSSLSAINSVVREDFLSQISAIKPLAFRMGSGREEIDGAVSFLIRFIGRDQAITGELYIRQPDAVRQPEEAPVETAPEAAPAETAAEETAEAVAPDEVSDPAGALAASGVGAAAAQTPVVETPAVQPGAVKTAAWIFDDLILEEPRDRSTESDGHRFDFYPYERFF